MFLIVPGLFDSDANHWQTRWQKRFNLPRVVQSDWSTPDIDRWAQTLERHVRRLPPSVVILAHSFGCLATVLTAERLSQSVSAALLVAPADPEKFGLVERLSAHRLPFPSVLIGSQNDPWMKLQRAQWWAALWQSGFVDLGRSGHINSESGFGHWPGGWKLARSLAGSAQPMRYEVPPGSSEWTPIPEASAQPY